MGILRECFSDAGNQQSEFFLGVKSAAQNPSSSPAAYNVLDQRSCVQSQAHFTDSSLEKSSHFKDGESCWFSTSFPDIFQKRLSLTANNSSSCNCHVIGSLSQGNQNAYDQSFEELESYAVRNLLPDDDELLSGIADEHHYFAHSSNIADEAEDFDLFSSGGGLELDADNRDTSITSTNKVLDLFAGAANAQHSSSNASMIGGHPYGEHPSRTLFVRNINSNVDDSELQALFEQYGKIRALYSACKHRGFVMVSYYDIRSAQSAMKALQNKPLRKRKLDIHFSIPKDNPTDKDINQGTLVVFNLDPSVSNDKLSQIFGVYGEVREIRETPHKSHHKFIEFYDVRAAEAALKALNKSDIAGKQIKLEPSRPGGARRVMQQFYQDFEQEASHSSLHRRTSPAINASSWGEITKGISRSCLDDSPVQMSPGTNILNSVFPERALLGTPSSASLSLTTSVKVPTSNHLAGQSIQGEAEHHLGHRDIQIHSMPSHNAYLLPEFSKQILNSLPHISPSLVSAISPITSNLVLESTESAHNRVLHGIQPNNLNNLRYDHENADHRTNISSPINGNQFNWESADCHYHCVQNSVMSSEASAYANPMFAQPLSQQEGKMLPRTNRHMGATLALQNCSIGSAPISGPVHFLRRDGHAESPETSLFHAGSSTSLKTFSPQKRCSAFSHSPVVGSLPGFQRNTNERGRNRRSDNANQMDSKKHFQLDVDKILSGEDTRTTLMIKNIPNKYTSKLLLATIDEHYRGTYDFIYLPIDFKNKCNVGYSFINMTNPMHVVPFYKAFNGKRWEKFNSEKVASLAYARIQGKAALIAHFQNSSLMNEDKRCRPIIFHTDGPNAGDQEPFPVGLNVRIRPGKNRNRNFGSHQGSPDSENAEDDNTHVSQSSQDSLRRRENR